jgi:hypothetical protein
MDRRRLWIGAQHAVQRAEAEIRQASSRPFDPGGAGQRAGRGRVRR